MPKTPTKNTDLIKRVGALKHTTALNTPDITPVSGLMVTHGIVRESPVDILYMIDANKERFIRVKVWSKVKTGLFRFTDIKCFGQSKTDMLRNVGMAAGAMAEQLIALYGDLVEPSECARKAGDHFRELCEHLEKHQTAGETAA